MQLDEIVTKRDLESAINTLTHVIFNEFKKLRENGDEVLDVPGAAKLLKCSEVTIRRRCANGEIAFSKEGKDLKILKSDAMNYLMKRRVATFDEMRSKI